MRKTISRLPILGPTVIDLARSLRDPTSERIVQADLERTLRELAWLRDALREPVPEAPRLLILSLTDMVYQLKLEAMLGAALKLRGWRPIVLTNARTNTRALRYFRAFGITELIYLDDFPPDPSDRARCAEAAAEFISGPLSFQTVKAWTFAGSWIGPQILSTISRSQYEGAPDPSDPATRTEIAAMLPEVMLRVILAERLVRTVNADLGLVIEANYALNGPLVDRLIAGGTSVIQVTQPWRDDALTCFRLTKETRRMHPSSISPATFETIRRRAWGAPEEAALDGVFADRYRGKWFLQARNQPGTRDVDATAIRERLALDPAKKTATVFSHVLWDANLFFGEDLFQNYGEWFVETVRAAAANPHLNWLIKLHPANLWKRAREGVEGEYSELRLIRDHIGALPQHVTLLYPEIDIATLSLFRFTDYGVTVRGTSGMELPCFGKPTVTAGTGRYSSLGFTDDSTSPRDYLERLTTLHLRAPLGEAEIRLARRHAHAVFLLRPWRMETFRSVFDYRKRGFHALDHNLRCSVTSLREAEAHGDFERWALWAASSEIEYLEPR